MLATEGTEESQKGGSEDPTSRKNGETGTPHSALLSRGKWGATPDCAIILWAACEGESRGPKAEFMEERDFFDEKQEKKPASLNCPHCHESGEYEVTWIVRTKKRQLNGRADERDRARFAKFRSYMVRKDDVMACKNMRCRKRFDLTGQSTVITD